MTHRATRLYNLGATPNIEELPGKYEVKMLGWMKWFPRNHKFVTRYIGFNELCGRMLWGRFIVRDWVFKSLLLDYDVPGNGILSRRIRDYIRKLTDNVYIGKFCYVLFGKPRFLGYFILRRVDDAKIHMDGRRQRFWITGRTSGETRRCLEKKGR